MLWTFTPSYRKWWLASPRSEDVDLYDIAHNLSLKVGFDGSCGPYSVAEHSAHCHDEACLLGLPNDWCFLVLLHDAHEAYIGDIITPMVEVLDVEVDEMRGSASRPGAAIPWFRAGSPAATRRATACRWTRSSRRTAARTCARPPAMRSVPR